LRYRHPSERKLQLRYSFPSKTKIGRKLDRPASKSDFMSEIKGHVIAEGELVGTYQKK